jgi:hypothetical protein
MRRFIQILALTATVSLLSGCGTTGSTSSETPTASQTIRTGETVNLSWTAPSTRADGSYLPVNQLASYRIYRGTTIGNMAPLVDLEGNSNTEYTVTGLSSGSYYFAVSAFDTDGLESSYSQIILIEIS